MHQSLRILLLSLGWTAPKASPLKMTLPMTAVTRLSTACFSTTSQTMLAATSSASHKAIPPAQTTQAGGRMFPAKKRAKLCAKETVSSFPSPRQEHLRLTNQSHELVPNLVTHSHTHTHTYALSFTCKLIPPPGSCKLHP